MIESYSFGRMVIEGRVYTQDLIIYPDRIEGSWWRKSGHSVCHNDIKGILEEKPDVLVVGKGSPGMMDVLSCAKRALLEQGITLIEEPTENAFKTYNKISKNKKVCGAFHLTC
ncbi:MAG: MTH938/NDUFAF3 family protein [bacterium]